MLCILLLEEIYVLHIIKLKLLDLPVLKSKLLTLIQDYLAPLAFIWLPNDCPTPACVPMPRPCPGFNPRAAVRWHAAAPA